MAKKMTTKKKAVGKKRAKKKAAKKKATKKEVSPRIVIGNIDCWCRYDEVKDITTLIEHPRNPNTHPENQILLLSKIIRFQGWRQPITVSNRSGFIVKGHGRLHAAQLLGSLHVPVEFQDYASEAEEYADLIADNRIAELADLDNDGLAELLSDDAFEDFDMDLTGFEGDELAKILAPAAKDGLTDDDAVPDPPKDPVTKLGDLWLLGEHRLLCGDSTDVNVVGRVTDGEHVDICFTSPPYGVGESANLRKRYKKGAPKSESFYDDHADDSDEWSELMDGWYAAIRPVVDAVVCNVQLLAPNKIQLMRWVNDRATELVDVLIWDKIHGAPQMAPRVLTNVFEFIFVFGGNGSRTIPHSSFHGTVGNMVRINPRSDSNKFSDSHQAVMPCAIPEWIIGTLCNDAKTVIEPFCGTGTTIITAEKLGRKCYGIEISPAYVDITIKRWEEYTGKKATLSAASETIPCNLGGSP